MLQLAYLAAFVAVFLLVWATASGIQATAAKRRTLRHLDDFESITVASVRQRELAAPLRQRVVQPGLRRLARFGQTFTPVGVITRLDEQLVHAGIENWDGPRLLAVKILTTAGGAFTGLTLVPFVEAGLGGGEGAAELAALGTVFGIFGAGIGYYIPEWVVRGKAAERAEEMRRALPDALDLLSISVSAGLGFEAALDRVSREMGGILGAELYRVVQEMRLGQGRSTALRALSERTDVAELDSFVVSMVQAEAFGVPIARVLATQADELRLKRRQRAEEQAQKIPVKILFPLIACIFPVLFIVILGPAGITIYENVIVGQIDE